MVVGMGVPGVGVGVGLQHFSLSDESIFILAPPDIN